MTNDQFDAIAQLMRLRTGAQQDAARLVLVGGMRQVDAARQLGISTAALGATMRACRRGVALAGIVCGAPPDPGVDPMRYWRGRTGDIDLSKAE